MPSNKQPFRDKPVNAAVFIALSRIVLVLLLTLGTYHLAIGLGIYPLIENAHDKYPLAPLYYFLVCTWNRSFYLLISILPLIYLLWHDRDKLLKDSRILLADILIWINAAILLYQWDSLAQSFLYYAVFLVSVAIYTIANIRYKKEENKNENAFKSCFGAEADNTEDGINRGFFYHRTVDNIREALKEPQPRGTVWALYGEWGSGKTHLLNHIERELQKTAKQNGEPEYIFCNVNLWQVSNRDELWKTVERTLEKAYGIPERIKWAQRIQDFLSSASELDARYAIAHTICKEYLYDDDAYNLEHLRLLGERNKNKRFILFFDNLERSNAKVIKELLPLLERLKRLPNLMVIAAVAIQDLIANLKNKNISEEQLRAHMMKLTDNIIYIPPMGDEEASQLFIKLIDEKEKELGFPTYLREYAGTAYLYFKNPREIYNVVDILINLEIRYFSEGRAHRKKSQIENSIRFVELVYDLELLKVLYSDIYHALYRFCLKLKENKKITPPDDYWVNNNINIQNDTLLDVLLRGISEYSREEYLLAANMEYTNRNKLLPNLCDLISNISYESYNSKLNPTLTDIFIETGIRINSQSAIHDILRYTSSMLNAPITIEKTIRYASIFLNEDNQKYGWHHYLNTRAIFSILFLLTIQRDNYAKENPNAIISYLSGLNFKTIASLTSQIVDSLRIKDFMHCRMSIESPDDNDMVQAANLLNTQGGRLAIEFILERYITLLLNEISANTIQLEGSSNVGRFKLFRAFEALESPELIKLMQETVLDYCNTKQILDLEDIKKFLYHLASLRINLDENQSVIHFPQITLTIFSPYLDTIVNHVSSDSKLSDEEVDSLLNTALQLNTLCLRGFNAIEEFVSRHQNEGASHISHLEATKKLNGNFELLFSWLQDSLFPAISARQVRKSIS